MKPTHIFTVIFCILLLAASGNAAPQEGVKAADQVTGFVDKDKNGINDKFKDAEGDGINDITGKSYKHNFKYADENNDSINDLWTDKDGDGVNDLARKHGANTQNALKLCVLDNNEDGVNDITGQKYSQKELHGHKYGFIDERTGKIQGKFMDEDGDGIDDRMRTTGARHRRQNRDMFVDEDGDGICDGRGERLQRKGRQQKHGRGGKH
jgi:hypothetical protein